SMKQFHYYSYKASRAEKVCDYSQAAILWAKAALFSEKSINKEWSLWRKAFCEKKAENDDR
ncbi:TPA: ANR family transcriptional regulator, partial [Escherichia coli]|nr:ANR family transcriptional regulator [Escherichia coli]